MSDSGASPVVTRTTQMISHARVQLALHCLRPAEGWGPTQPLLLLHSLGESSPDSLPVAFASWTGPVWALDFTGHGMSTVPMGGGYTCEVLMADVDQALSVIGPATIHGRGLGGYIALLIAGARPKEVRGAIIDDGTGLRGRAIEPGSPSLEGGVRGAVHHLATPDPFVLTELADDVRPPDYATSFARLAVEHSDLEMPVAVVAVGRPPWLGALVNEFGVLETNLTDALDRFMRSGAR
jgi:pimeloyl-ACP methyl ester carboxylesterase